MRDRVGLLLVLIVVGGIMPAAAVAGGPDRPGRARFELAETKFNLGRFDEAAVDYQAAYEAEPLPAFLFNIGQCYRNVGDYGRAQFYFRRYVELDPRSSNRSDAERLIAEMNRRTAGQRSTASPRPDLRAAGPGAGLADEHVPAFGPAVADASDGDATRRPLYRRPWFWIGGAAVVAAAIATTVVITRDDQRPSLPPIDAR